MHSSFENLKNLYDQGRKTRQRTLSRGMISTGPGGRPVIATIMSADGQNIGSYWISDMESLMNSARMMGDTPTTNPNLIVLKVIMQDMVDVERGLKSVDHLQRQNISS